MFQIVPQRCRLIISRPITIAYICIVNSIKGAIVSLYLLLVVVLLVESFLLDVFIISVVVDGG